MAGGTGRPINVGTANVGVANIARVTRSDPNTGETKTGESVILGEINDGLGKIDQTFREYLAETTKVFREELQKLRRATEDNAPETQAPNTTNRRERRERLNDMRDRANRTLLKRITDQLETLNRLTELNNDELSGQGQQRNRRNPGGAGFDNAQDRLSRLNRQHAALQKVNEKFLQSVTALREQFNKGTIGLGKYISNLAHVNASYILQRARMNSVNKTTNRLANSFNNLISGVDGIELMLQYIKQRYSADGGYKTMIQSGYGGISEAFLNDLIPNISRDSLFQTSLAVRRNAKADPTNELLIAGQDLQAAATQMLNARDAVSKGGYSLLDRMSRDDAKDTLMDIAGTLKRAGMIERIDDATSTRLMTEQLKTMQLAAENTGMTVEEVRKNTAELRRRTGNLVASGRLTGTQKQLTDQMLSLVANSPQLKDLIGKAAEAGFEPSVFMNQNKDLIRNVQVMGGNLDELQNALLMMQSGQGDPTKILEKLLGSIANSKSIYAAPQTVLNALGVDKEGLAGAVQQYQGRKQKSNTEDTTLFGVINRIESFFKENVPWDAIKAIGGAALTVGSTIGLIGSNVALTLAINRLTVAMGGSSLGGLFSQMKGKGLKGMVGAAGSGIISMVTGLGAGAAALGGGLLSKLGFGRGESPASPAGPATAPRPGPGSAPASPGAGPVKAGLSKMGSFTKTAMKGGALGLIGSAALMGVDSLTPSFSGKDTLMAGAQGALLGATIGSVIPVVGTLVGAAVGGGLGMIAENLSALTGTANAATTASTPTSVAAPPDKGWQTVGQSINDGFSRSVQATERLLEALKLSNEHLDRIKTAIDKTGSVTRSTISQATLPPMSPGVKMY